MANITPNQKDGKIVSYRFRVCVGRDETGKQEFRSITWKVPEDTTPSKVEKVAQKAAERWEKEVRTEYAKGADAPERVKLQKQVRKNTDFVQFIEKEWFPVCIDDGEHKPKTLHFYNGTKKNIGQYFGGQALQKISPVDVQKFII